MLQVQMLVSKVTWKGRKYLEKLATHNRFSSICTRSLKVMAKLEIRHRTNLLFLDTEALSGSVAPYQRPIFANQMIDRVFSVLLYGIKSWTWATTKKLNAFDHWLYQRILRILNWERNRIWPASANHSRKYWRQKKTRKNIVVSQYKILDQQEFSRIVPISHK